MIDAGIQGMRRVSVGAAGASVPADAPAPAGVAAAGDAPLPSPSRATRALTSSCALSTATVNLSGSIGTRQMRDDLPKRDGVCPDTGVADLVQRDHRQPRGMQLQAGKLRRGVGLISRIQ